MLGSEDEDIFHAFPEKLIITLLSRGLKFIPTPVTTENNIRRELLKMRDECFSSTYITVKKESHIQLHPFHVKSD